MKKITHTKLRLVPPLFKVEEYSLKIPLVGCWLWMRSLNYSGYGQVWNGASMEGAHRFSWRAHHGEIPADKNVLHRCDVRCCVNPHHLYLGTHQQNMTDMVDRGRSVGFPGEAHHLVKLTDDQVEEVRKLYLAGHGTQACLAKQFNCSQQLVSRIIRGEHR